MDVLQAIILGVVQGITEFLPISSSGHLILFPIIFGWEEQGVDFDVMIHLATLLAILWMMREDVKKTAHDVFAPGSSHLGAKILAATVPVVIVGVFIFGDLFESLRSIRVVAVNLMLWGAILSIADFVATRVKPHVFDVHKTTWRQAIVIGCMQVFALLPGTSRSGVTISTGLFLGQDRPTTARFSFLLAIPAILGASVLTILDVIQAGGFSTSIPVLAAGFLSAFIAGSVAIKFLLKVLAHTHFQWFAAYRIALGAALLVYLALSSTG